MIFYDERIHFFEELKINFYLYNYHFNGFDFSDAFGDANDQGRELLKSSMQGSRLLYEILLTIQQLTTL